MTEMAPLDARMRELEVRVRILEHAIGPAPAGRPDRRSRLEMEVRRLRDLLLACGRLMRADYDEEMRRRS